MRESCSRPGSAGGINSSPNNDVKDSAWDALSQQSSTLAEPGQSNIISLEDKEMSSSKRKCCAKSSMASHRNSKHRARKLLSLSASGRIRMYITIWKMHYPAEWEERHPYCGGLTIAGLQVPTKPLYHSVTSTGEGEKTTTKSLMGWDKDRERPLTNYHHG